MLMPSDRITQLLEHQSKGDRPSGKDPVVSTSTAPHDPYDFIVNPGQPAKKKLLGSGGNSKTGRILIVGVGALGLILLVVIVMGIIRGAGSGVKDDYLSLIQQQNELIRIADIGLDKAEGPDAKNMATTAHLTLTSQQPTTLSFAKKTGVKIDAKTLALGRDAKTDALLTKAEQNNKFDAVFMTTLREKLKKYQQTLKKVYDQTSTKTTKDTLSKDFTAIGILAADPPQPTEGTSPSKTPAPATN